MHLLRFVLCCVVCVTANAFVASQSAKTKKCQEAPSTIADVKVHVNKCREKVKDNIIKKISEAAQREATAIPTAEGEGKSEALTDFDIWTSEKVLAGCLVKCVFDEMNALDTYGLPDYRGIYNMYAKNVHDYGYQRATSEASWVCIQSVLQSAVGRGGQPGLTCSIAYDVYECMNKKTEEYCSTP